ncbi:hypothetical protein GCM10011391_27710 [Pullulanibacillus camelliae]|uniref:Uncharacterized protein n=1 Tax=Pullulanibacillus camelliae TaxID=1707096 RepID=A0A8J3DWT9_9BACL|nr:hypothetical protein GCM10011391_27710 [Pullulanibacillus camelliae]
MSFRCAGPECQHYLLKADLTMSKPQEGIRPRYSGLRVQGTATSPLSTIDFIVTKKKGTVNLTQIPLFPFFKSMSYVNEPY